MGTEEPRERMKAMWALGDYPLFATRFQPIADDLVQAAGIGPGERVLDVATGTGNVAMAAAREGATVVALDLTPRMLDLGRARAAAAGFTIKWLEAGHGGPAPSRCELRRGDVRARG